jgi:hypothetical protein
VGASGRCEVLLEHIVSDRQPEPYQDDFTAVYLTMLTGTIVIPQGEIDVHQTSESSSEWE